jgi:hypothetical protein
MIETAIMEIEDHHDLSAEHLENLFDDANRVADINERFIKALPSMDIEQVFETARYARGFERAAYLLRGACAAELVERATRLAGGAGKRDVDGTGVRATVRRLAKEAGVDARTIDQDYQIYATFYAPRKTVDETSIVSSEPPVGLTREMHVLALKADDPHVALELFATKAADDSSYTAVKAAADLAKLKTGTSAKTLEDIQWINCPFNRSDIDLLRRIAKRIGLDPDKASLSEIVQESVRRYWSEHLAFSRKPEHMGK